MYRIPLSRTNLLSCLFALALALAFAAAAPAAAEEVDKPARPGGQLQIIDNEGKPAGACPLKHTDFETHISGYLNRTVVKQVFENPLDKKIEATYTFPLSDDAAVDRMVMVVGDRRIEGQIKKREEAREVYEQAKAAGHVASLLEQDRPNIFMQSVANIEPGAKVVIEISYVETLPYSDGRFELVLPTVVGPRFIPGGGSAEAPGERGRPTPEVPDGDRITPPIAPEGERAGHDINITVHLDAGMPIQDIESALHDVNLIRRSESRVTVKLVNKKTIPNRDFILEYALATDEIQDAFLVHEDDRGKFFTFVLQPPKRVEPDQAVPKELIFVIDRSGSMRGTPIETAKKTMRLCIQDMNPKDRFNLHSFSGGQGRAFDEPVVNTKENREQALKYLKDLYGSGGTRMMPAIKQALGGQPEDRVRIVVFMTDGYIGNDFAIIDEIQKSTADARVFGFGIGNSVNRFLLDNMSREGRGEVQYVPLRHRGDSAGKRFDEAAERFYRRVNNPVLTHIEIDWGKLPVSEVYPKKLPDLFDAKPILVHGRLAGEAEGALTLKGRTAKGAFTREIAVSEKRAEAPKDADAMASLWARRKIDHLTHQDLRALQQQSFPDELKEQVTQLGLEYDLMTPFTSFVAVEKMRVTAGGEPVTVDVPVEMPEGVSHEGVFDGLAPAAGPAGFFGRGRKMASMTPAAERLADEGDVAMENGAGGAEPKPDRSEPIDKLAKVLRDLARQVEAKGEDGDLDLDGLKVRDWTVDVMVYLGDLSDKTREALKELGFKVTGESKAVRMLIGSIDVRKLEDLAKLEAVRSVKPVKAR